MTQYGMITDDEDNLHMVFTFEDEKELYEAARLAVKRWPEALIEEISKMDYEDCLTLLEQNCSCETCGSVFTLTENGSHCEVCNG